MSRFSNLSLNTAIIAFYFGSHQQMLTVSLHLTDLDEHSRTLRLSNLNWFSQLTPCSEGDVATNKCTALVRVASLHPTYLHLQWCKNDSPAYKCKNNGSGIPKQEQSLAFYIHDWTLVCVLLSLCPLQPLTHDQRDKWPAAGRLMDKGDCVWGAGRPSAGAISRPIVGLSGALGSS